MLIFRFASYHYGFWLIAALGALLGLKQFLTAESPLKMMKNAFYFTLKTLFIPESLNSLKFRTVCFYCMYK